MRHSGLDVTVDDSDRRRARVPVPSRPADVALGARTKPPRTPRISAAPTTTTTADVKEHLNGKLATISMARKLARRCFHVLRAVDPDVVYAAP